MEAFEAKPRFDHAPPDGIECWGDKFSNHCALSRVTAPLDCLIGDSHAERLARPPHYPLSQEKLPAWHNLGCGGDRAEHILWRVREGGMPGNPRKIILISGSNNISAGNTKTSQLTANTIVKTTEFLTKKIPKMQYRSSWCITT